MRTVLMQVQNAFESTKQNDVEYSLHIDSNQVFEHVNVLQFKHTWTHRRHLSHDMW